MAADSEAPRAPAAVTPNRDGIDAELVARRRAARRRASGIYGTIIAATVLAAAGSHLSTAATAVAIFVTLVVYWAAEQYAELLGERAEPGHLPSWERLRAGLADTWSMVTASYLPVLVLIVARLLRASATTAANIALFAAVVLLLIHGWAAGRAADLHGRQLAVVTLIAGALGAVLIVLKNFVLVSLH
jgi:hypothetical protein